MALRKYPWDIEAMKHQYLTLKLSTCDIAKAMGVDHRLVHYHLKRAGVSFRTTGQTKEQKNDLKFDAIAEQIKQERIAGARVTDLQVKYAGYGYPRVAALCNALPAVEYPSVPRSFTPEQIKELSARGKAQYKRMTPEQKANLIAKASASISGENNTNFGKVWGGKGHGTRSYGTDSYGNSVCFRSSWEDKFASFLTKSGFKWRYEPETFRCGKLGTYTPDFYVDSWGCFVEVKGWLTDKAKAKIDWFRINCLTPLILSDKSVLRNQYGLEIR